MLWRSLTVSSNSLPSISGSTATSVSSGVASMTVKFVAVEQAGQQWLDDGARQGELGGGGAVVQRRPLEQPAVEERHNADDRS